MTLKISVVTATLNRRDFLPRCIEGVARQSHPDKEHVIIDGRSTDGTVEFLKSAAEKYPHIRWISEKDNGVSNALNKGLALASGDIIGVNGDDDFYQPGTFEIVAAEFEQDPSVGVVSGDCEHIRNDGTPAYIHKSAFTNRQDLIEYWKNWGHSCFLPAPSTFFRRTVVDMVGGFEEADFYCMDYHHWIKITEHFKVKTVDKVFASFRYDEGSITYSLKNEQWAEMYGISKKYWGSRLAPRFYWTALRFFDYQHLRPWRERARNSFKYRVGRLLKHS